MQLELALFTGTAALYTAATALAWAYLFSRQEQISRWMFRLLALGVIFHLASFGVRLHGFWLIPENRYLMPINSFFGALSYMSLAVALTFAVVLGSTEIGGLSPALRSYWMNLHPMALMTAYSIFGNAFGVGLALLVQEYQIKSRKPTELCYRLPAIEELDSLNYNLIACGFPVLFAGIAMGILWAHAAWESSWMSDAKVIWALITAMVYGSFLLLRFQAGWRGRKAVYMSMLGFACVVFTFAAVNFISQMHGYL
jgi:ABC-type transport system involved in cytochrome c biogenesis permease subunit